MNRADAVARALLARTEDGEPPAFEAASLDALPGPAARWLGRALPDGSTLTALVELSMVGEIALKGRWMPFRARQILRAGVGFVWRASVGRGPLRFRGADALGESGASLDFRLWGLLPVARASGADVRRSALGRLAAETVMWLPQALTPQRGAVWRPIDDHRSAVVPAGMGSDVEVEVVIDQAGGLREARLNRWDAALEVPRTRPFGGTVASESVGPDGVRIAGSGEAGWDWGTPAAADGLFFRYRITEVTRPGS